MTDLQRLRAKLCRELAQSEQSARVHPVREARRLECQGLDVPPARALRAIADHAERVRPRLESLVRRDQPISLHLGAAVGRMLSAIRHLVLDRAVDVERSFRGTLLGLRHGIDTTRLLRAVAHRLGDVHLVVFCDELLADRLRLVGEAEASMTWFADQPARALRSGLRMALPNGRA